MTDSDIQFLGNWNSSASNSFVSAIMLIPNDGSATRTFSRDQTSCVHIGRIPASTLDDDVPSHPQNQTIKFSNPVMSRMHAKITFADLGSAHIIDTSSHHGTWISRPTSTVKLSPERGYMLLDGDEITFGKEVLKDGINHKPLTVSIKLLRTNSSPPVPDGASSPSLKPRNRFGLDTSSTSDLSDSESIIDEPHPDEVHVELTSKNGHCSMPQSSPGSRTDSTSSKSSISIVTSPPTVPKDSTMIKFSPPRCSVELKESPSDSFNALSQDTHRLPPPGLTLCKFENLGDPSSLLKNLYATPVTPPWRRAIARAQILSANNSLNVSKWVSENQARPGNSLLISSTTDAIDVDVSAGGGRIVQSHDECIPSDPSLNEHRGEDDESTREYQHGHHGSKESLYELNQAMKSPVKTDRASEPNSRDMLCARLDELTEQLAVVRHTLRSHAQVDEIAAMRSTLTSLETTLTTLRTEVTAIQDDVCAGNVDIGALRVDLATLRAGYKDDAKAHSTEVTLLRSELDKLRVELSALPRSINIVTQEVEDYGDIIRAELLRSQKDCSALQERIERIDVFMRNLREESLAFNPGWEDRIIERVREEFLRAMRDDMEKRSSPSGGTLKRGYDEAFAADDESRTPAMPASGHRRKRLRTIVDFAAVGALGALGAFIGLAYLQL